MQAYQKEGSKSKKSKTKKNRANLQESIWVLDETLLLEIASDGLQALCYELGLEALHQILEQDVEKMAGPKGKHNPNRQAYRHGTEKTKVVLGGEKLRIDKPRVRSKDGGELNLPSLSVFQSEDPLNQAILSRILCGVSTRKYRRTVESAEGICTNKSEVSRRYHQSLTQLMDAFFKRPIQNTYPILMLDGMAVGKMMVITALGITDQGEKHILGLLTGATENSSVVKEMLADLIQRGLDPNYPDYSFWTDLRR